MSLDFSKKIMPVSRKSFFQLEGYFVWGGTMVRHTDGLYYLLFARWPQSAGHDAWVTCSEIGYAVSESPTGPFAYKGIAIKGDGDDSWDAHCIHNPTMIPYKGKYYLYYMGNRGDGTYWNHRNNQRIGVAVADHPAGPWQKSSTPVIDVSPGSHDHLMTSNPTATITPDGRILMVYKAVGDGVLPKGGPVVCGVAFADHPLGPFRKEPKAIMQNPENDWSVEDPFIWRGEDRYYAIVKDFQGYFTKRGKGTAALFESACGIDWKPSEHTFAFEIELLFVDGTVEKLEKLERPQIYLEDGKPRVLLCAGMHKHNKLDTFNVQIPLKM